MRWLTPLRCRLRQCCDHPFLTLGKAKDDKELEAEVTRTFNRFERQHVFPAIHVVDRGLRRFLSRVDMKSDSAPSVAFLSQVAESMKRTAAQTAKDSGSGSGSGSGSESGLFPASASASASASSSAPATEDCPICLFPPDNPVLAECGHLYCR